MTETKIPISIYKIDKTEVKGKGENVYIFGRDKNKKKIVRKVYGHKPYFYVDSDVFDPSRKEKIQSIERDFNSIFNEDLVKINTYNSFDVPAVRKPYNPRKCYEDDVLYYWRWLIDLKLKNGAIIPSIASSFHYQDIEPTDFFVPPRRLHIDIEVISGEGGKLPDWERANKRITSISVIDNYTRKIITFTNRKEYGSKLNKKMRVSKTEVLFTEETPYVRTEKKKITTETGSTYNWIIKYYKTQILVKLDIKNLRSNKSKLKSKKYVEIVMLKQFLIFFKKLQPDMFCGWNIEGFDLPYLTARMRKLKLDYKILSPIDSVSFNYYKNTFKGIDIKGVVVFDTMKGYKKLNTHKVSLALNDAANNVLGYGKVKYGGSLDNLYDIDEQKFLRYNAIDVIAEYEIYEKKGMSGFFSGLKQYIGIPYEDVWYNKQIVDFYLLAKAKLNNIVLPSARDAKKKEFSGGRTPIPLRIGRSKDIVTIDLKSLYPCIMISWNLGNDVILGSETNINEVRKSGILPENWIKTPPVAGHVYIYNKEKISFISECLKELITYRDKLKAEIHYMKKHKEEGFTDEDIKILNDQQIVVKFITNSIYGVLGHANFRLYDIRIAESVTTIGRMILNDSIELLGKKGFMSIGGDSITGERCIAIKTNNKVDIIPIKELWERIYSNSYYTKFKSLNRKEHIIIGNIQTLSKNGEWKNIKEIIRHKINKKIYRINQKNGETICTEDHSLIDEYYNEIKPTELGNKKIKFLSKLNKNNVLYTDKIDLYSLLKDKTFPINYKGRQKLMKWHCKDDKIWFGWTNQKNQKTIKRYVNLEDLCRVLGIYIADGHSSLRCGRFTSGISSSNREFMEEIKKYIENINNDYKITIIISSKEQKRLLYGKEYICKEMYRIQMNNNTFGALFHFLCNSGSENKKLPSFIYNTNEKYQKLLYKYYLLGDGSVEKKMNSFTTKSLQLVSGLCFLLKSWKIDTGIYYHKSRDVYRVRERINTQDIQNPIKTRMEEIKYDDYVYDLSVEDTEMFVDCCGMLLLHNTDSCFIQLEIPKSQEEIDLYLKLFEENCDEDNKEDFNYKEKIYIGISYHICNLLNEFYKTYEKKFNLRENFLQIKPEDVSSVFFNVKKKKGDDPAKKKYAKRKIIEFDLDKPIKINYVEIKGFVRSNLSVMGKEYIKNLLDMVCTDKNMDVIEENKIIKKEIEIYLRSEIKKIKNMEYPFIDLCRNVGINKDINEYGNDMHVRAARWVIENAKYWNGSSNLGKGSTVKYLWVEPKDIFYPHTRTDVIALDDNNYIPDTFYKIIDFTTLINKTIVNPLEKINEAMKVDVEFILHGSKQEAMF